MSTRSISAKTISAALAIAALGYVVSTNVISTHAATQATITTDQNHYSVGEPMTISGNGFSANAPIGISVLRPDRGTDYVFNVAANSSGAFTATYAPSLPLTPGRYRITATDGSSTATTASTEADAAAASPEQCRNGSATDPNICADLGGGTGWVTGNVGSTQGHFVEGYSIPYRMNFTGVTAGTWTVDIGYDTVHSGAHAIDFLTQYDRINDPPHQLIFNHTPECIDPTDGKIGGAANTGNCPPLSGAPTSTFAIPTPTLPVSLGANPPGNAPCSAPYPGGTVLAGAISCPGTTFGKIAGITPAGTNNAFFSMWNGTINSAAYVSQNVVSGQGQQHTRIRVVFTVSAAQASADGGNVVLAYGGHIGREQDWGTANSAGGISGSPYHMNLEGFCSGIITLPTLCDDGGAQDRSLSAATVFVPPTLTIVKTIVNDSGGSAVVSDFGITTNAGSLTFGAGVGTTTKVYTSDTLTVAAGTYSLHEGTLSGYTEGTWSCSGTSGTVVGDPQTGSVVLTNGDTAICSITNNDNAASLTIVKTIVNDNGGTAVVADFGITTTAGSLAFGAGVGTTTKVYTATALTGLTAGTSYSLHEGTLANYTEGTWSCTTGGTVGNSGNPQTATVTLALGANVTCSITNNDDAPQLTIVKTIVNDNGGTAVVADFGITTTAGALSFGAGVGTTTKVYTATALTGLAAGTSYTLHEGTLTNYTEGTWSCTTGGTVGNSGNPQTATVTLAVGANVTCSITNNDNAPGLTIVKTIVNDNGGTAVVADFGITTTAGALSFGAGVGTTTKVYTATALTGLTAGTSYTLHEGTLANYTEGTWSCTTGGTVGNSGDPQTATVTLALGASVTCSITNNDNAPGLTIVKTIINDNGGTAVVADFGITTTAGALSFGAGVGTTTKVYTATALTGLTAGTSYTLHEGTLTNYTEGTWSCTTGGTVGGGGNPQTATVTLALGASVTCSITNNDNAPGLTIVKTIVNDNGGTAVVADCGITTTAGSLAFGAGVGTTTKVYTATALTGLTAGTAYTLHEGTLAGYTEGAWSCTTGGTLGNSGNAQTATVTLALGASVTCSITNNDNAPSLTIVKTIVNDNGGAAVVANFGITTTAGSLAFGAGVGTTTKVYTATTLTGLTAGTAYTLHEGTLTGYAEGTWSCTTGGAVGNSGNPQTATVALALGANVTCSITNNDIAPTLLVQKTVQGGSQAFSFTTNTLLGNFSLTPSANGTASSNGGVPFIIAPGSGTVDEVNIPATWALDGATCIGASGGFTPSATGGTFVAALGDNVVCSFLDIQQLGGATRTQGYWATHTALTNAIWTGPGTLPAPNSGFSFVPVAGSADAGLCLDPTQIDASTGSGTNEVMGGFWSAISSTSTAKGKNGQRSDLDQARMQFLQQYLAAVLNVHAFGTAILGTTLDNARFVYCNGTAAEIRAQMALLATYNQSGDIVNINITGFKGTPQESKNQANILFWDNTTR